MIVLIDNYDSFVHNLGRYIELLGKDIIIKRNDAITLDEIEKLGPEAIILSPGPCAPAQAGICKKLVERFATQIPILGVCLGHQVIAEVFNYPVIRAEKPAHGKASRVYHENTKFFKNIPSPFHAGRYHSLIADIRDIAHLKVTAGTEDGIVMAIEHQDYPLFGVQFHPESILTEHGSSLLENFLHLASEWNESRRISA